MLNSCKAVFELKGFQQVSPPSRKQLSLGISMSKCHSSMPMDPYPLSEKVLQTPLVLIPQSHFLRRYNWNYLDPYREWLILMWSLAKKKQVALHCDISVAFCAPRPPMDRPCRLQAVFRWSFQDGGVVPAENKRRWEYGIPSTLMLFFNPMDPNTVWEGT